MATTENQPTSDTSLATRAAELSVKLAAQQKQAEDPGFSTGQLLAAPLLGAGIGGLGGLALSSKGKRLRGAALGALGGGLAGGGAALGYGLMRYPSEAAFQRYGEQVAGPDQARNFLQDILRANKSTSEFAKHLPWYDPKSPGTIEANRAARSMQSAVDLLTSAPQTELDTNAHLNGLTGGLVGGLGGLGLGHVAARLAGSSKNKKDDKKEDTTMEENKKAASENLSLAARAAALSVKLAEEAKDEKKEEPKQDAPSNAGADDATARRRQAARARAKDLLNTSSFSGGLADYLTPRMWGGHRAGRATQIAQALGQKPSFNLRHPLTSDFLSMLGGGLGGAALGGGLGGLAGAMSGNDAGGPAAVGALLGAGLGGVAAPFVARGYRRGEMDRVRDSLEDELAANGGANIKPVSPNFGALSSIFLPAAGAHRAGQADAYQALKNNERYAPGTGRNLAYMADIGSGFLGPVGLPIPLVRGWAQNFNARGRTAESRPRQAERYGLNEFAPADPDAGLQALPKAASLRKAAKVYEAAEAVEGMKPKETYESHKKCAPGEFGMHKEGGGPGGKQSAYVPPQYPYDAKLHQMLSAYEAQQNEAAKNKVRPNPMSPEVAKALHGYLSRMHKTPANVAAGVKPMLRKNMQPDELDAVETLMELEDAAPQKTAFEFGNKVAFSLASMLSGQDKTQQFFQGAKPGMIAGGVLGGLSGLLDPGADEQYDSQGRVIERKQRSRLLGGLSGALTGSALGGVAGGAMNTLDPGSMQRASNKVMSIGRQYGRQLGLLPKATMWQSLTGG